MKRGQITIFIIVGIVILLVIALGVFAVKFIINEKPPEEDLIEQTADEVEPVRTFMKDCLDATANNVFDVIGAHGGYYDPLSRGILAVPTRPTQGNGFEPFEGLTMPYWYYMASADSCSECEFSSARPPLNGDAANSIASQAEEAIESQLNVCLRNFQSLENKFVIEELSAPNADVNILDEDILIDLNYELKVITGAGSVVTLSNFTVRSDIPVGKAYNYALAISDGAREIPFFEGLTLEAIVLDNAYESNKLPPPYGSVEMTYTPGPFWVLENVKRSVAYALSDMVSIVQVLGSNDMVVPDGSDLEANQYANYFLATREPLMDATVTFTMLPSWTPYVKVSPGGQIIQPDVERTFLPIIPPIKRNEFQYDVSYPVLVELRMQKESGQDYYFSFAQEVNMRNNEPLQGSVEAEEESTNLCDPQFANAALATITINDDTSMPLEASVDVECAGTICQLGAAPGGVLNTRLPYCIGGTIRAYKEGYGEVSTPIVDGATSYDLKLPLMQTVTVKPQVQFMQRSGGTWTLDSTRYDVPNYQVIILFTPVLDQARAQAYLVPGESTTVQLSEGEYEVTGVVLANVTEPKILKGKQVCVEVLGFDVSCETVPDITLGGPITNEVTGQVIDEESTFYIGGLRRDAETSTTHITYGMISDGEIVVPLAVVNIDDLVSIDDLDALEKIDEFAATLELE